MLGLRQKAGVDVHDAARRAGFVYPPEWHARVKQLEEDGWIEFDGAIVRLTSKGRLAANSVIEELLWPTPASIP